MAEEIDGYRVLPKSENQARGIARYAIEVLHSGLYDSGFDRARDMALRLHFESVACGGHAANWKNQHGHIAESPAVFTRLLNYIILKCCPSNHHLFIL